MNCPDSIQELRSLISLLDDPDDMVYHAIEKEIIKYGDGIKPHLIEASKKSKDSLFKKRINNVLLEINFKDTALKLEKWKAVANENLLLGILIIANYQYPDLDESQVIQTFGQLTRDIIKDINPKMSHFEKINVINRVLFDEHGFYGNKRDISSLQCLHLHLVLETGRGNHLTLGIIYLLVAKGVGLNIAPFYFKDYFFLGIMKENRALYYINPFSKGNILSKNELKFFLKLTEVNLPDNKITPSSNADILSSLIDLLISAYEKLNKPNLANDLKRLLKNI